MMFSFPNLLESLVDEAELRVNMVLKADDNNTIEYAIDVAFSDLRQELFDAQTKLYYRLRAMKEAYGE